MGVTATDKVRKLEDGNQILPHGPSWGSIWYDVDNALLKFNPEGNVVIIQTAAGIASTFDILTADPVSPANMTWWVVSEGSVPTQVISLKVRVGGNTLTLMSITVTS
jgi:hypothetical protein